MTPRLIAISGSLKGTIFALTQDETAIGRETSNAVCLNDRSVSRRHCLIKREPTKSGSGTTAPAVDVKESKAEVDQTEAAHRFVISDLESYNGTFVNGLPIKEQRLAHGDQIAVGDIVFLFLQDETDSVSPAIQSAEGELITRSTVRLRAEDALYLRPEKVEAQLPANARVARDLNTLLKIGTKINSICDLPQLQTELLRLMLEVIPAEREAILLVDRSLDGFSSVCGWNTLRGRDDSIKVSQTVTNQVLRDGVALLSNDLFETEGLGERPSLVEARVCSVLCVPLLISKKALGVIYLDTSDPQARFDEGHLQLLTAIAGIAAAPFENASRLHWLEQENHRLQKEFGIKHQMIGESAPMRTVYQFIGKVAPTHSTVLLRGESGTGKELAAHALHLNGKRADKAFIAINCATLSETLLESELFGHEKGAFTGAIAQKKGKLEIADGGTLFLDEVGELTPPIQAKLLRVLQEREFDRLGGTRPIKVDVRIITATNKDLEAAVSNNSFRQDLYYRLNVLSVTIPPLRDRREDIQLLASHFAKTYSENCKRRILGVSPEARVVLQNYRWPGNVRELQNAIERAIVLGSAEMISPEDLPEQLFEGTGIAALSTAGYHEKLRAAKRQIVIKAVEEASGNYAEAARQLGLHPTNLHRLIRNLDLKPQLKQ
jgi:transcriptional regulator with GAF, ATPase, and Fis domain